MSGTFVSICISVVFAGMMHTAFARSFRPDDRYHHIFPDNIEDAQRNYRNAKAMMHPQLHNPEEESMMPDFEHHESGDAENEISNELDSNSPHGKEGHMHDEEGHSHGEEGHSHGEEGHSHGEDGHSHGEDGHSHGEEGHSHGEEGHAHEEEGHSHDEDGHSLHGDEEMDSSEEGEGDDESEESDMGQGHEGSSDDGLQSPGLGFLLGNPFLSLKFVNRYFVKLERILEKVFRESMAEAMNDMYAFTNTSDEVVDIDGQKYKIRKTLIKKGDENSSLLIETLASELLSNQTEVPNES